MTEEEASKRLAHLESEVAYLESKLKFHHSSKEAIRRCIDSLLSDEKLWPWKCTISDDEKEHIMGSAFVKAFVLDEDKPDGSLLNEFAERIIDELGGGEDFFQHPKYGNKSVEGECRWAIELFGLVNIAMLAARECLERNDQYEEKAFIRLEALVKEHIAETDMPGTTIEAIKDRFSRIGARGKEIAKAKNLCGEVGFAGRVKRAKAFADALWQDVVFPQLKRTPSIVVPLVNSFAEISKRGAQVSLLPEHKGKSLVLNSHGKEIAQIESSTLPMVDGNYLSVAAMGTKTTQRIIRHVIHQADKQFRNRFETPEKIEIEGGYNEMAKMLGMKGKNAPREVRESFEMLNAVHFSSIGVEGRILSCNFFPGHKGKRSLLRMYVMGPLRPDYVTRALQSEWAPEKKHLVPIPLPTHLPPLVGRANDEGAQCMLQILVLREFRHCCEEMESSASHAIEITKDRWDELMKEVGVPKRLLTEILTAYEAGDDSSPPFLKRVDGWRFALSESYIPERDALLHAAKIQNVGRKGGKKSSAKKLTGYSKRLSSRKV